MKKFLLITITVLILAVVAIGCTTTKAKSVVSTWAGTFTGQSAGSGTITDWKLFDDNSFTGNWTISSMNLGETSGTYTLVNTTFVGTGTGTATSGDQTDKYTLTLSGTVDTSAGTGSGTYSIDFETWPDDTGTWTVAKQ